MKKLIPLDENLAYLAYNKRVEKLTFFDQNHWLTPLKKFQFFNFFKLLFLWCRKMFFHSRLSWNTFSWLFWPTIKEWRNWHFLTKTIDLPLWKNFNFSTFLSCCFYGLEKCFFILEYRETQFPGLCCLK